MIRKKEDVYELDRKLQIHKDQLERVNEEFFDEEINRAWKQLIIEAANEKLKNMPVDTISTLEKGMPINVLVSNGKRTIYDLKDDLPDDLMRLDGIGEKTAYPIYDAVQKIKKSVMEQAKPRMNPDRLSNTDYILLEAIYKKWRLVKRAEKLKEEFEQFYRSISPTIETAKKKQNFIFALFQSRKVKAEINEAYEKLNSEKFQKEVKSMENKVSRVVNFSINKRKLKQHFVEENASYYSEIEKVVGIKQTVVDEKIPSDIVEAVNQFPLNTNGLDVILRNYQSFGAKYALHFKRTLLGDEMGLGKTIQALAMIHHLYQNGKKYAMVVCPLSVLANWKREIKSRSQLNVFIFHGNRREEEFRKWQRETGVLLTTYEQTLRMDFREEEHKLDALVVDEAHYVKNPDAKRSQSVYRLTNVAEYVLYMSGTPLENRLEEMKQLISVLQSNIAERISRELHLLHPDEFKRVVAPVYLRRNRKDVLAELPELEIIEQWVEFGEEEWEIYRDAVLTGHLMLMRRAAWLGGSPSKSPKLERLLEICDEAKENGQKVIVFSFFRDVIDVVKKHLEGRTFEPITGGVPNARRQEIVDEFTKAEPGSVLICQITAGGVGLNIQAANIVILCEPQWKPSTEEQAISRAYRMGQSRDVVVYRLLTEDSIDATMLDVLGEKAQLFDLYARKSEVADMAMERMDEIDEETLKKKVLEKEKERVLEQVG